jgi:hypothetical protein
MAYGAIREFCNMYKDDITQEDMKRICKLYQRMLDHCGDIRGANRRALQVIAIDRIISGWNERWRAYYDMFQVQPRHFSGLYKRFPDLENIIIK